jgi:hypothetical protein
MAMDTSHDKWTKVPDINTSGMFCLAIALTFHVRHPMKINWVTKTIME